jgi:hypothetical protein
LLDHAMTREHGAMLEALVALMVTLAPEAPRERLERVAQAIAAASHSREEAALLLTIDYYETRFERSGIPFGLFSWRHRIRNEPLAICAGAALRMLAMTARCGDDVAVRLGWYHTGHCRADPFSEREAETYRHALRAIPRE